MAESNHTIVVTSNVLDARNRSNHFYNVLGRPLDLSRGQWVVAIKKMIYLNSFLNIVNETITTKQPATYNSGVRKFEWLSTHYGDIMDIPSYRGMIHENFELFYYTNQPMDSYGLVIAVHPNDKIGNVTYETTLIYEDGGKKELPVRFVKNGIFHSEHIECGTGDIGATAFSVTFTYSRLINYHIPPGNYEKLWHLLEAMNKLKIPGVEFKVERGLVHLSLDRTKAREVILNNHLELTLGFSNKRIKESTTASYLAQLNRGRFAFFIYSNLVQPVRVGDMEAPLLDVISLPKREFAEIISLDVVNPLYSPVALKQVNEIEILLATDSGEPITFDNRAGNAKTLLVLHFQRT